MRNRPQEIATRKWSEISPNQTAYELFAHLKAGEKVAITTRFHTPEVLEYVQAMEGRGLIVRVIAGLKDVEDFCFLLQAKRGLAGGYRSTFFRWAAILGQAEHVQMCTLGTKGLNEQQQRRRPQQHLRQQSAEHEDSGKQWSFFTYN